MSTEKQDLARGRILDAAESLLKSMGRDALTIRAVADAAEVQLPAIYRLFEDKVGLLDAVTERGFVRYMEVGAGEGAHLSPIEQLREGWNIHIRFGLENPQLYNLMYGESHSRKITPAAQIALDGFHGLMGHLAASGSLKVSQEEATFVAFASASGAVTAMYFLPNPRRQGSFLESIREAMITSVTTESPAAGDGLIANAAATLGGNLHVIQGLSQGEKALFREWLDRMRPSAGRG